jgi:uncharacterized protein YidB (DUF937 family)
MGLFDEILGKAIGTQGEERTKQSSSLVAGLLELLDEPETGGVQGLEKRSQGQGLGELVASWIGTGSNRAISADQLTSLLGAERVESLGQGAGLSGSLTAGALAALLPALIDKLTPDGKAPTGVEVQQRGRSILREEMPASARSARPRVDFSNVRTGSSSAAAEVPADFSKVKAGSSTAAASPPEPQTYVVVSGDSLSKIAKRIYGDAKEWRQIFEANRDQLENPDLIHPGQKLRIPKASKA